MKESKFIELLNLYVDHQISPAEAELLEAEVKSNPARRQIYHEYCAMQKGCSVLAETFRTDAPASDSKRVEFKPRRFPVSAVAYVTSLAAVAACVAVVFTLRSPSVQPLGMSAPQSQVAVSPLAASAVAATPVSRPVLQPAFGPKVFTLRAQNAELTDATTEQGALAEWMNNIQLSTLRGVSADDLRFDAHANVQPDIRSYRAGRPIQGKVESTAFTFQK